MQTHLAHQSIHQERRASHVAAVLEQADEQEKKQNLRQKNNHGADALDDPGDQQAVERAGPQQRSDPATERVHAAGKPVHRVLREREDALKQQRHDDDENDYAPDFVRQDAVHPVAQRFLCLARASRHFRLNLRETGVA